MSDEMKQKIEELARKLKTPRHQRSSLNGEAEEWAEKRNAVHKQTKDLRLEARNIRERRDAINAKVKALKTKRDQVRATVKERIQETKQLKGKLSLLDRKKPRQTASALKKRKEEIEWKIQTTSLTLQEEKPLVQEANRLRIQLDTYQQIGDAREKFLELQSQIQSMNEEARLSHTQLLPLARQGEELHKKMMGYLSKAETLQLEADQHHQSFLQCKQKSQKLHEECVEVETKIEALRRAIAEAEEEEKMRKQEETRRKLKERALRKLKEGGKLTLEEFKLTAEEEKS